MRVRPIFIAAAFFLIVFGTLPTKLLAAPYYEGKIITIVVGWAPGGGFDRMARLLAKHLPRFIPGKPKVMVQNMPGATGLIAANYLYNIAKPDGQTIVTLHGGTSYSQMLKAKGVKFDLFKFSWIGSSASETSVLTIRTDLPYKTFNELVKAKFPIVLGTPGTEDVNAMFPVLLREFGGLNAKMILYPSSADIMLAIERKEVDGRGGSYSSVKPFIDRGLVRPLIRSRDPKPGIENLPVDEEVTTNETGKTMMRLLYPAYRMGRPYVAPPKTPASVMGILREAFAKAAKDPEVQKDANKIQMPVEYVSADECVKLVTYVLGQPEDIVKKFGEYVKF